MAAKKSLTKTLPPLNPQETFRQVEWVALAYLLPNVQKRVKETPTIFFSKNEFSPLLTHSGLCVTVCV